MVGAWTCQHRSPDVQGPTCTLACSTNLAESSNPLTPAQNQLGGVAHAALWLADVVAVRSKHYGGYPIV